MVIALTRRIVVLGANGFIGRHVAATIAADPRYHVVAGTRQGRINPPIARVTESFPVDAFDAGALRLVVRGADTVVNCIAASPRSMVASFRLLCDAARAERVSRIVHFSSMAVYGNRHGIADETTPLDGSLGDYAAAKIACEAHASLVAACDQGLGIVVLRPSCVFGPGSAQWTGRIGTLLRTARIGDLGAAGDGACNLAYIDDVAAAAHAALDLPPRDMRVFNVSSPEIPTWNDFLIRFGCAIGATPIERISPRWLAFETRALAPMLKIAERAARGARLGRLALPPALPPSLARLWRQNIRLDHRAADRGLGFSRTKLADAIDAAARWFVAANP